MQQQHLTTYADIAEVRTVTGAAACNQLLAAGWVLLVLISLFAWLARQESIGRAKR